MAERRKQGADRNRVGVSECFCSDKRLGPGPETGNFDGESTKGKLGAVEMRAGTCEHSADGDEGGGPRSLDSEPVQLVRGHLGETGGTAPAVLNAANEEAVAAFLAGRIGFLDIEALVADALAQVAVEPLASLDVVRAADGAARAHVAEATP